MPRLTKSLPKLSFRKQDNRAYCTFHGKKYFFGIFGTKEAQQRYASFIAEISTLGEPSQEKHERGIVISEMCTLFIQEKSAKGLTVRGEMKSAIKTLLELYANMEANKFQPSHLDVVRHRWVEKDHTRKYISMQVSAIKQIFKWARYKQFVDSSVCSDLEYLPKLDKHEGRKSEKRTAVPTTAVLALVPFLPSVVADMLRVQLLTAMRPSELFSLRWCDIRFINVDGVDIPFYCPEHHKTEEYTEKRVPIPPVAYDILQNRALCRVDTDYLFPPIEATEEAYAKRRAGRKSKKTPSQILRDKKTENHSKVKNCPTYNKDSYRQVVRRAIEKANENGVNIPYFTPYQIRHEGLTQIQKKYGIEVASAVAGHKSIRTTEVYLHNQVVLAARICEE